MKFNLIIGLSAALVCSANAAVTIAFNATSGALSNFHNASGTSVDGGGLNRMVWGILVDAAGDGFDSITSGFSYQGGFSLAANNSGFALSLSNLTVTDDVLYINSAIMASSATQIDSPATGEVPANQNRLLAFSNLNFNGGLGVAANDPIAIMWFDKLAVGGTADDGMKYGIYDIPVVSYDGGTNFADRLPADLGSYTFAPAFAGADAAKTMDFTLATIPEPSTALLAAFGSLALLRRRRN